MASRLNPYVTFPGTTKQHRSGAGVRHLVVEGRADDRSNLERLDVDR